jgi:hypothetical protein
MPVPDFSPGEVLTAAAMDSIGLWKVTTVSFTAATAASPVDLIGCFTSDYLNYLVKINLTAATANVEISAQMLSGTTPASGGNYRLAGTGATGAAVASDDGALARTTIPVTFSTANGTVGAELLLYQPQTAVRTNFFCDFFYDDGGTLIYRRYGGQHNLANSYDGLRIFSSSGNITGTATVYGYRI